MTDTETYDASRRTRLANERTYLAWWRTGFTALAVCVALGRVVPDVSNVTKWPFQVVGAAYGVLGIAFIVIGRVRVRAIETAIDRGEFARLDSRLDVGLVVVGVVLALATIALVVFTP